MSEERSLGDYVHEAMLAKAGTRYVQALLTNNARTETRLITEGAILVFSDDGLSVPNPMTRLDRLHVRSTLASFGMNEFLDLQEKNDRANAPQWGGWASISSDPAEILRSVTDIFLHATIRYRVAHAVDRAEALWRERATTHEAAFAPNGRVLGSVTTDALNAIGIPLACHRGVRHLAAAAIQSHSLHREALAEAELIAEEGGTAALLPEKKREVALAEESELVAAVIALRLAPIFDDLVRPSGLDR